MDEGLEPHELAEQAVEHHQHAALHGGGRGGAIAPAVASAVLAVLAALGSLLSGDATNEALLQQLKASDTWSYYQATRLKDHVYDVSGQMLRALGAAQATGTTAAKHTADSFLSRTRRYAAEENALQSEARRAEAESRLHLGKHRHFAFAVACFQVGIVLASITILVRYRWLFAMSMLAGAVGAVFMALGILR